MNDVFDLHAAAAINPGASQWVVFSLGEERFALPMASVETVTAPPRLAVVPHAMPALLGAGNLAGQIIPIVDLARLLGRERAGHEYDGRGEILRLRTAGGHVGLWIDRVERLVRVEADRAAALFGGGAHVRDGLGDLRGVALIDPTPLLATGLIPPDLGSAAQAPLGEVGEGVSAGPAAASAESFILVEAAGTPVQLQRDSIVELIDTVPWTRIPRSPPGFWGIGVLRGVALPILSLAGLLGLPDPIAPAGFAVADLDGRRVLLAVDRVIGLRFHRQLEGGQRARGRRRSDAAADPADDDGEAIDLLTMIPDELRDLVLGFSTGAEVPQPPRAAIREKRLDYLSFVLGGQDFAVPIASIDRVVETSRLIALPRAANDDDALSHTAGAIELRGQIMPVAAIEQRLGLTREGADAAPPTPGAYVILRGPEGLGAIAVDQIKRLVSLRPEDIVPPPAERGLIDGVAAVGGGEPLRLIAPDRLWATR